MRLAILFIIGVFLLWNVGAISSDLRENYQPGETIIAEIAGNILEPLNSEDVEFKRGHVLVPLDYELKRVGDKWYLWAISPLNENNYTISIKDISTTVNGVRTEIDFEQNFSVSGELIDYSVRPGFILSSEDFSLDFTLNKDFDEVIDADFPESRSVVLKPGSNKIEFSISGVEGSEFILINAGRYSIPAYITKKDKEEIIDEGYLPKVRFKPRNIESIVLRSGEIPVYPIIIINDGLEEVLFELEFNRDLFFIEPSDEEVLISGEGAVEFNLSLKDLPSAGIDEKLIARSGDFSLELPVFIELTENQSEVSTPYLEENFTETSLFYCNELSGKQCSSGQECSGEIKASLDGNCCIGLCVEPPDEGGINKFWLGLAIFGVVVLIVLIVWVKFRGARKNKKGLGDRVREIEKGTP